MTKFAIKVSIFVLLAFGMPILCAFGPIFLGGKLVSFKCPDATTVLIGDSTCEYGLDDSLIPGAVNMGHSASSIPHSYWRLKKYLDENPQTRRVIFTWQPDIFTDKHVAGYGAYTSLKHLPFMSLPEIAEFYSREDFKTFFKAAFNGRAKGADPLMLAYIVPKREYWGRYRKTDVAKLKKQLAKGGAVGRKACSLGVAPKYWVMLLSLIKERDLELMIFLPPLYHYDEYYDRVAETERLNAILPEGAKILDFTDFHLPDDEFRDRMHLNSLGARRLSPVFAAQLQ